MGRLTRLGRHTDFAVYRFCEAIFKVLEDCWWSSDYELDAMMMGVNGVFTSYGSSLDAQCYSSNTISTLV